MSKKPRIWIIALSVVLLGGVFALLFLPIFGRTETFTELDRNMLRLKQIGTTLRMFAQDSGGRFPESLDQLVAPDYFSNDQLAESLYRDGVSKRTYDWIYFGGFSGATPDSAIIAASPSAQLCAKRMMHHRIVLHADTVVEFITDEEYRQRIAEQNKAKNSTK